MKRRGTASHGMFLLTSTVALLLLFMFAAPALADLKEVKERGVLRHLGVVYANFVTGSGDGLDVELMKLFAERLGVRYEFVETSWGGAIGDVTGKKVVPRGEEVEITGEVPIKRRCHCDWVYHPSLAHQSG